METKLAAGIDPTDPAVIEEMKRGAEAVRKSVEPPDSVVTREDLTDDAEIAGMRCRPLSAGIMAVLEMADSPLFKKKQEGDDEEEMKLGDMLILVYLLMADVPEMAFVAAAEQGYQALRADAVTWSFRLDPATMGEIKREIPRLLAGFSNAADLYLPRSDDKKK